VKHGIPPIFRDQTVAIVAGGPSLKGFQFDQLAGTPSIAINRAHEFMPRATMLYWGDAIFWRKNLFNLLAHQATWKVTLNLNYAGGEIMPPVVQYTVSGREGYDPKPGRIRHGNNSAYAAMHLAVQLGARRLVLFGVDMHYGPNGESHFHSGYDSSTQTEETLRRMMLPHFASLVEPFEQMGVEVFNASPDSALRLWPRVALSEGVAICTKFLPTTPSKGHSSATA